MPSGRDKGNKFRPIGIEVNPFRSPTEGTSAEGRYTVLVKDEFPVRIEEVNDFLYYLGWAELNSDEAEPVWKIRRIRQIGSVWYQEFAYGNQFFRYKWVDRAILPYA